ncbi:hypothetical protein BFJ71_g14485 [Fusarium oxysporum]|nr:hypothetical protein BFJ71_g14485 [Fusarium oxysporum]
MFWIELVCLALQCFLILRRRGIIITNPGPSMFLIAASSFNIVLRTSYIPGY